MRKKHFIGFVLLVLIINFLLPLTQAYQVFGDEKETISEKIIDTPELKINYVSSETNEKINWKFNYSYQKTANTKQKLKLELIADGKSIPFQSVDGWNYENNWFVQDEFSETATGTVELVTELSVTNVMLRIQADELSETETITTDVFTSEIEGPHQLRLPVVNPKNEIPVESTTIESSEIEMTNTQQEEAVTDDKPNSTARTESEQESLDSTEPSQTTTSSEKETTEENLDANSDTFEPNGNFSIASSLDSLTNYPAINPEYTTNENGTYPKHYWNPTNNQTVRNHQGKKFGASGWDGNNSWDGNSNNVTDSYIEYGGTGQDADFAIRKYAKETSTPGLYDVYLNVRGNQKENIEPVDIVLVVDMSGSMEPSSSNGWNDRAGAVRAGVKEFFQLINQAGIGNYVNVGFVGYSSPGYVDLIQQPIKPVSDTQHVTNINNALSQTFNGGTFTQNGIEKGNDMLLSSTNSNKMMILLTDGVPTFSKRVTQAVMENGTVYGTSFHNSHQDQPGNTSGLRSGAFNSWSNYTAGTSSNSDPNIIPPNSGNGRYYDTTNGIRIWNTWAATLGAAKIAQNSGSILHTLGIQLGADLNYLTEAQVRARASLLASPGLYRDAETTAEVTDYLLEQAQNVVASFNTIVDGSIIDPIGTQFSYDSTNVTVRSVGSTNISNLPTAAISNGKLDVTELNLGKGQEVQFHYQVRINTEDEDFTPEKWYPMNGPTKLTPDGNNPNNQIDFGIPSAKAPGIKLNLKKIWEEYDKDTSHRPDYLDFSVERSKTITNEAWKTGYLRLVSSESDTWERQNIEKISKTQGGQETLWLPKFNNQGNDFIYKFSELNVPDGYEATSNEDGTTWINRKIFTPLGLKIVKISDQESQPLTGAQFKLTGGNLPNEGVLLTDKQDGTYQLEETKLELNSEYALTEIQAPNGHTLSNDQWIIKVSDTGVVTINNKKDGITIEGNTIHYTIENQFKKLLIATEKYSKENNEQLNGARLTLRKYEDSWNGTGTIVGEPDDLIANDVTSTKSLTPGFYSLQETVTPTGYKVDDTIFKFQVDIEGNLKDEQGTIIQRDTLPSSDGWYLSNDNNKKVFVFAKYNQLRQFEFSILKKDAQTNQKLAGAVFEVRKQGEDQLLAKLTTNSEGTGKFIADDSDDLFLFKPGTYLIKEVAAPEGFVVLEEIFKVVISDTGIVTVNYGNQAMNEEAIEVVLKDESNNTIEVTIANTPKGLLPATGGQGRKVFVISSLLVVGIGIVIGGYYVYRNRKELE
ncbi:hypothetical protein DOK78_002284 [Enterococcus sp. DIV2402]|uniref:VWFA domain-containing protein n=1 Tax=Candidatus Enterococcus lowellii TaxID=2230877 RepID=A0ABZ2ST76_9ENTE|nr:vWA domain-containing protein [Enterococcus sp. DIV2402]MBO0463596.1 VWA domain-containing protein [Enterococcus sp. DIV2402]